MAAENFAGLTRTQATVANYQKFAVAELLQLCDTLLKVCERDMDAFGQPRPVALSLFSDIKDRRTTLDHARCFCRAYVDNTP